MIDCGIHPPTMYFPTIVPEALMFEPTETESKETLDINFDAIYLLKGWEKSKGAKRELFVALQHDLMVVVEESEERKLKKRMK